jgi:hypothetical protein
MKPPAPATPFMLPVEWGDLCHPALSAPCRILSSNSKFSKLASLVSGGVHIPRCKGGGECEFLGSVSRSQSS